MTGEHPLHSLLPPDSSVGRVCARLESRGVFQFIASARQAKRRGDRRSSKVSRDHLRCLVAASASRRTASTDPAVLYTCSFSTSGRATVPGDRREPCTSGSREKTRKRHRCRLIGGNGRPMRFEWHCEITWTAGKELNGEGEGERDGRFNKSRNGDRDRASIHLAEV